MGGDKIDLKFILKKIVIPSTCNTAYGFVTYLMEYGFTFTFTSQDFCRPAYDASFTTALIGLVTLTFDL